MTWNGYFAAEDLNLNASQRSTLTTQLRALGTRNGSNQPNERNHWRISNDNSKVIFQAVFSDDVLSIPVWKQRLSVLFGVDVGLISHSVQNPVFDTTASVVVTFSYAATNYFRVALFGGVNATLQESRAECRAYLVANSAEWNPES